MISGTASGIDLDHQRTGGNGHGADGHGRSSAAIAEAGLATPVASNWWPRVPLSHRYRTVAAGLLLSDTACAVFGLLLGHVVLVGWAMPQPGLLGLMAVVPIAWIASFHAFGLYSVRHLSAVEELRRLVAATCVATSLVSLVRAWSNTAPYRRWLVVTWLVALALELVARRAWRWKLAQLRGDGRLACRTVIVGTNEEAERLGAALADPYLGFEVIGYLTVNGPSSGTAFLPVVGRLDYLDQTIRTLGVECVFVAASAVTVQDMVTVAGVTRQLDVEIRVSANLADTLTSRVSIHRVGDLVSLSVKPVRMSATRAALKRTVDVCAASVALVVTLPLLAVIAVLVRLSSPGPIFFRQPRVTKGGRVFPMLKFRTMVERPALPGEQEIDLTQPFFKLPGDDPRVTRLGRVLRRLSLDEMPQLWQVVRGDLSLVGPRPLPVETVMAHQDLMSRRHEVRAGITGWWQINGRSSMGPGEAVRKDLFYIENWSLSLDLFILLKTAGAVLSGRGAR